jgi:N-acylglucosamine 2-epimerase
MINDRGLLDGRPQGAPGECRELMLFYEQLLRENLLPWWLRHAPDHACGGFCTCLRDDGSIVSHDKYVWSQLGALWTFAAACNRIDPIGEWRNAADQLFRFVVRHAQRPEGDWNYLLTRDGRVKEGPTSIHTDAVAIGALVEYARLTDCAQAVDAALRTYRVALEKLRRPGTYAFAPYHLPPGARAQRVSMQFASSFLDLGRYIEDHEIIAEAMRLGDDLLDNFRRPEHQAVVEYLALDNRALPAPAGTYMAPGQGIETAWCQIENLRGCGQPARTQKALEIMRWSFAKGWDPVHGGLFLGVDLNGKEPYLPHAQTKVWWPHAEALCGALLAHEACGERWCLDWYAKAHNWAFAHFPDRRHGEWIQCLTREGQPLPPRGDSSVKDPFHLPRAAMVAIAALERQAEDVDDGSQDQDMEECDSSSGQGTRFDEGAFPGVA